MRALGMHHIAFLRATLLGMDACPAFERYLAFGEPASDARHIETRRRELLSLVVDAARRLGAARPTDAQLTRSVELLQREGPTAPVVALPSLDEWVQAQGIDPDMWSEAELLAEYQAAHGLDNPDELEAAQERRSRDQAAAQDIARERVRALNHLSGLVTTTPSPSDPLEAWFAGAVAARLHAVGVATLDALYALINRHGHRWPHRVPGLGARRAPQIVAWLAAQSEALQRPLIDGLDEPASRRALRLELHPPLRDATQASLSPRTTAPVLVPFERLALPAALRGVDGVFRGPGPNALEALDDMQAVQRWLSGYADQPATFRSYRKEVERFILWCATVQEKPVSSATALDAEAYRAFLHDVPADWMSSARSARSEAAWRPFRGPPSPASQMQALVIVQAMFEGLRDAGYLTANPMRVARKDAPRPTTRTPVERAFSQAEWAHVRACLAREPDGPARFRLRALLALLVDSGLRLDELARASYGDLRCETLPGWPPTWVLSVSGRRGRPRDVPLSEQAFQALQAHSGAAQESNPPSNGRALILALAPAVPQWQVEGGQLVSKANDQPDRPLSAGGICAVLKRFFARVALSAGAAGLEPPRFEAASTHWLRHTFGRQSLAEGAPLDVVSKLLGHASLATTALYAEQNLARKIAAAHRPRLDAGL